MEQGLIWLAIVFGAVVIVGLLRFIVQQRRRLVAGAAVNARQTTDSGSASQRLSLEESLEVIAGALLENQVEVSEACIRIKVLLDHYQPELHEQEPYTVFTLVYEALEHMPTHQARKQTDKKFVQKMDQKRFAVESRYREQAQGAARQLLDDLQQRRAGASVSTVTEAG